ncbi:MAG TPA: hypothetical protein VIV15_12250 [Anaerolineales bacterium]
MERSAPLTLGTSSEPVKPEFLEFVYTALDRATLRLTIKALVKANLSLVRAIHARPRAEGTVEHAVQQTMESVRNARRVLVVTR